MLRGTYKNQAWHVAVPNTEIYYARNATDAVAKVRSYGRVLSEERINEFVKEFIVKVPGGTLTIKIIRGTGNEARSRS